MKEEIARNVTGQGNKQAVNGLRSLWIEISDKTAVFELDEERLP